MRKKLLYFSTVFFIVAFPFMDHFYNVFRGLSVSLFHHFEQNAPFAVKHCDYFQKYIRFYLSDFWIVAIISMSLFLKRFSFKELCFNDHSRYLTFYSIVAIISISLSLFSRYYFEYITIINFTISSMAFHLVYLLFRKQKRLIPLILSMFILIATLEAFIGLGQFLIQKSLGLHFLSELHLHPMMKNVATYPLMEENRVFFEKLLWIPKDHLNVLRAHGTFESPNIFGGYLMIALFISYYLYIISQRKWQRSFLLAIIPLFIMCLVVTFSRGALFSWILGSLIFFGASFFCKNFYSIPEEKKRCFQLSLWIILGGLCAFVIFFNQLKVRGGVFNYNSLVTSSDSTRFLLYKIAITLFLHNPIFGIGYNGFPIFPYELVNENFVMANSLGYFAHNIYLQVAAETGIIGFTTFFLFFFSIARSFFKTKLNPLILTLGTILFSLLLTGLVDNFLLTYCSGRLMLFIFSALLAAVVFNKNTLKIRTSNILRLQQKNNKLSIKLKKV